MSPNVLNAEISHLKSQLIPQNEAKLDKGVQELTGQSAEMCASPESWESLREELRLQVLYAGEHVVFRDHRIREANLNRLVLREILFHSPDWDHVQTKIDNLSSQEKATVHVTFVEDDSQILP